MIKILLALIMIYVISLNAVSAQSIDSLNNAEQAYLNNDFDAAIQFFELTVSGGIYNGDIFYNLGTAHYQLGNIGDALLNYRRALQYLPRDLDLNIQLARTRALRDIPTSDTTQPIILLEQLTDTILTINELSTITFIVWTIFWLSITLYQIRKSWRSTLKPVVGILIFFTFSLAILLGSRLYIHHSMPPAVVTTGLAPIYSGPSISYFRQYDLFEGSEIYIIDEQEEWAKFVTSDNRVGWVEEANVTILEIK